MDNIFYGYWEITKDNFKQFEPKLPTDEYTLDSGGWEIVGSSAKDFFPHFFPYRRRIIPLDDPEWELVPLDNTIKKHDELFYNNAWHPAKSFDMTVKQGIANCLSSSHKEIKAIRRRKQSVCPECKGTRMVPKYEDGSGSMPCLYCITLPEPTKPAEPKPDDVCECGHTYSMHWSGKACNRFSCRCKQFRKKGGDDMQTSPLVDSMKGQPRPETAIAGVGPVIFDEWYAKEGFKFRKAGVDSRGMAYQGWLACETSKQPPGRWVLCSKRLPVIPNFDALTRFTVQTHSKSIHHEIDCERINPVDFLQWYEPAPIPTPPAIEQDEDEKAWYVLWNKHRFHSKFSELEQDEIKAFCQEVLAHARKGKS